MEAAVIEDIIFTALLIIFAIGMGLAIGTLGERETWNLRIMRGELVKMPKEG